MHVRFSTVVGMPVIGEHEGETLGHVSGIVIHPDIGKVEGFFVRIGGFSAAQELYCASQDILRFSQAVHVRDADHLAHVQDIIRILPLLREKRTILKQRIITEKSRTKLGVCIDVQFDTASYRLEWLFPSRFFMRGSPIPSKDITEVTKAFIVVREWIATEPEEANAQENAAPITALSEVLT